LRRLDEAHAAGRSPILQELDSRDQSRRVGARSSGSPAQLARDLLQRAADRQLVRARRRQAAERG